MEESIQIKRAREKAIRINVVIQHLPVQNCINLYEVEDADWEENPYGICTYRLYDEKHDVLIEFQD